MIQPNSITFDHRGNTYVTDSADARSGAFHVKGGASYGFVTRCWRRIRISVSGPMESRSCRHATCTLRTPISRSSPTSGSGRSGNPGVPELVAVGDELLTIDGLVADARGNLHAVIAGASIF